MISAVEKNLRQAEPNQLNIYHKALVKSLFDDAAATISVILTNISHGSVRSFKTCIFPT